MDFPVRNNIIAITGEVIASISFINSSIVFKIFQNLIRDLNTTATTCLKYLLIWQKFNGTWIIQITQFIADFGISVNFCYPYHLRFMKREKSTPLAS